MVAPGLPNGQAAGATLSSELSRAASVAGRPHPNLLYFVIGSTARWQRSMATRPGPDWTTVDPAEFGDARFNSRVFRCDHGQHIAYWRAEWHPGGAWENLAMADNPWNVSESALRILNERPSGWPGDLFCQVLTDEVNGSRHLISSPPVGTRPRIDPAGTMRWTQDRLGSLMRLHTDFQTWMFSDFLGFFSRKNQDALTRAGSPRSKPRSESPWRSARKHPYDRRRLAQTCRTVPPGNRVVAFCSQRRRASRFPRSNI